MCNGWQDNHLSPEKYLCNENKINTNAVYLLHPIWQRMLLIGLHHICTLECSFEPPVQSVTCKYTYSCSKVGSLLLPQDYVSHGKAFGNYNTKSIYP